MKVGYYKTNFPFYRTRAFCAVFELLKRGYKVVEWKYKFPRFYITLERRKDAQA
jgi:predicted GNAT superfamily acetyltransferase